MPRLFHNRHPRNRRCCTTFATKSTSVTDLGTFPNAIAISRRCWPGRFLIVIRITSIAFDLRRVDFFRPVASFFLRAVIESAVIPLSSRDNGDKLPCVTRIEKPKAPFTSAIIFRDRPTTKDVSAIHLDATKILYTFHV